MAEINLAGERTPATDCNYPHYRGRMLREDLRLTRAPEGLRPGETAPDFELADVEGREWRLSELRRKPVPQLVARMQPPDAAQRNPGFSLTGQDPDSAFAASGLPGPRLRIARPLSVIVMGFESGVGDPNTRARSYRGKSTMRGNICLWSLAGLLATPGAVAQTTIVMTDGLRYEPAAVTVPAGTTVTWRNTSSMVHTVTANPALANEPGHVSLPDGAKTFNSGLLQPGQSFSHTFTVPGEYRYFCIPHEGAGMLGTVTVTR